MVRCALEIALLASSYNIIVIILGVAFLYVLPHTTSLILVQTYLSVRVLVHLCQELIHFHQMFRDVNRIVLTLPPIYINTIRLVKVVAIHVTSILQIKSALHHVLQIHIHKITRHALDHISVQVLYKRSVLHT